MKIMTRIILPKYIYEFYAQSAKQVKGTTPEQLMADALLLYAGMVSKPIAAQNEKVEKNREKE